MDMMVDRQLGQVVVGARCCVGEPLLSFLRVETANALRINCGSLHLAVEFKQPTTPNRSRSKKSVLLFAVHVRVIRRTLSAK